VVKTASSNNSRPTIMEMKVAQAYIVGKTPKDVLVQGFSRTLGDQYFEIFDRLVALREDLTNKKALQLANEFNTSTVIVLRLQRALLNAGWTGGYIAKKPTVQNCKQAPRSILTCSRLKYINVEAQ
jgi:hypothetical protein